jgi:glycosyltransferase involved in cell wall biosynthesis
VIDSELPIEQLAAVADDLSTMLSIVMPTFNEGPTLAAAIHQVLDTPFPCPIELIVVDDGSIDNTKAILASIHDARVVIHHHAFNLGKGAAVRSGIALAVGTHVVPFDADLEYAPQDLVALLEPVIAGRTDIVYGPRLFGTNTVYQSYRYAMGNKFSTFMTNVLFDSYISDLHTCLKLLPLPLARELQLRERGFGFDTELTAELLRLGYRPFEVPVSYLSRTRSQGKKLDWKDGLSCMGILLRVRSRRGGHRKQVQRDERSGELQLLASTGP